MIINIIPLDSNTVSGSITTITITITDNDAPVSVAFVQDTVTVDESNDSIKLTLVVSGQTEKAISTAFQISYRTANCDSSDFVVLSSGRISLNVSEERFITIKLKDDRTFDENDTFHVALLDPQNASLGTIKTCKVAIRDNDFKVIVQRADTNGTITPSGEQSVTRGVPLQIVATPLPHFHFTGWSVSSGINIVDASMATTAITAMTTGGTVTANFAIDSFNITFAAENGTVAPNGLVKAAWGDVLSPVPTAKPGFNFMAWSITADSIEPVGQLSSITTKFRVKGTGTIRALHSNKAYSIEVAFSDSRFGSVTPLAIQEKNWEETFEIKATPNANAKFIQWKADSDSLLKSISDTMNATATVTVRKSGKITAFFAPDSFVLTLQSGNTTMGRVDPATKRMTFFDSTLITATAETGYQFTGWTITAGVDKIVLNNTNALQTIAKSMSANATVLASFAPIPYAIVTSVLPDSAGTVISDPATSPQPFTTPLRLTASPNAGWKFDHWAGVPASQESNNPANVTVGTSNNFVSYFIPQVCTLYFVNYAGDTATTSISSQPNIAYGVATPIAATVTVSTLYSQKYEFKGEWTSEDGNIAFGTGNTVSLTSNAKIKPKLSTRQYDFTCSTIPASGAGGLSASVSSPQNYGTTINFTATPASGYKVKTWSGGNISATDATYATAIITGTTAYSVEFERENYSLTVTAPSNGRILDSAGGVMSGTYTLPFGFVVRLNASADTGYQFSSWIGATGNASTTITMDGSKTIGASFIQIPGKSGVIYVWSGLTTGNNTGANWANAYSDINTAVSAAAADAVIWVKCGEYTPTSTLTLAVHVKMYGGFNGFEGPTQDINNRNFYEHFAIIRGKSTSTIMDLSNGRDTIGGFVFKDATTNAVYIKSPSNCIEDCVIRNIGSSSGTRAIYIMPTSGTISGNIIQRCVFHSNEGTNMAAGKAIHVSSTAYATQILNSVFYKNGGPAINNGNTTVDNVKKTSIVNCTIVDNGLATWGAPGGIKNSSGITFLQGTILWLNKSNLAAGTQIDVADWVEDCDVQDHTSTGVATKKRWQDDNLMTAPGFGTLSILSDGEWFAPSPTMHSFKSVLKTADFTPKPLLDIRRYSRSGLSPFCMGAYEQ
ncbi:MAG TPA: Calx-beta domain-containing protein [Chitinispirillaceae bacterium]|nr:Calx-beta domain-containing protein [Chitinispirillaceae bacterium]